MRSMRKSLLMAAMSCCLPMFAVEDAAGAAPGAIEPQGAGTAAAGESTSPVSVSLPSESEVDAQSATGGSEPATSSDAALSTQMSESPVGASGDAGVVAGETADDPRIGLIHSLLNALETKLATGVHVFAHEVAAIREHIKQVL